MSKSNQAVEQEERLRLMLRGWKRGLPTRPTEVSLLGQELSPAEVIRLIRTRHRRYERVRTLRQQLEAALAERDAALDDDKHLLDQLVMMVTLHCGDNLRALGRFGVEPRKVRGKLSAEKQVVAKQREKKTRRLRGTHLGKRQRQALSRPKAPKALVLGPDGKPLGQK